MTSAVCRQTNTLARERNACFSFPETTGRCRWWAGLTVGNDGVVKTITLDDVDDPVLDLRTARIDADVFEVSGWVDLQGGRLLYEARKTGGRKFPSFRGARWERFPFTVTITGATDFHVHDPERLGTIVLDSVTQRSDSVILRGVIPGEIHIATADPSAPVLTIDRTVRPDECPPS